MLKNLLRLIVIGCVALVAACAPPPAKITLSAAEVTQSPPVTAPADTTDWRAMGLPDPGPGHTWVGCRWTHGFLGQVPQGVAEGCRLVPTQSAEQEQTGQLYSVPCTQPSVFGGYYGTMLMHYVPAVTPQCPPTYAPPAPYYGVAPQYGYGVTGYGPAPYGYAPYGHSEWRLKIGHAFSMRGGW